MSTQPAPRIQEYGRGAWWCERAVLCLFPRRCLWCGAVCLPNERFCPACSTKQSLCLPPETLPGGLRLVSVLPYHSPVGKRFLDFKFRGRRALAPEMGYAMAEALRQAAVLQTEPVFTFIPMRGNTLQKRGYNQSQLLARFAARWHGGGFVAGLHMARDTATQHKLDAAARQTNVRAVFVAALPKALAGRTVVLCDDICTTGATLCAAAEALQRAGAKQVLALTLLRTRANDSWQKEDAYARHANWH